MALSRHINAFGNDVKELIEDFNIGIENEKLSEYLNIMDLAFIEPILVD